MKWEEYQTMTDEDWHFFTHREKTNIQCPKCGAYIWRRTDVVLTSYPPKFRYECDNCKWIGTGR